MTAIWASVSAIRAAIHMECTTASGRRPRWHDLVLSPRSRIRCRRFRPKHPPPRARSSITHATGPRLDHRHELLEPRQTIVEDDLALTVDRAEAQHPNPAS